ncbi:hypothetical protein B0H11DRAFT_1305620 [Mycena galericulata]|nr:hypothetical protein B0H11DRAFT_1305620 [Mycena galericulata]
MSKWGECDVTPSDTHLSFRLFLSLVVFLSSLMETKPCPPSRLLLNSIVPFIWDFSLSPQFREMGTSKGSDRRPACNLPRGRPAEDGLPNVDARLVVLLTLCLTKGTLKPRRRILSVKARASHSPQLFSSS